jgi:hypothetical protein
MSKWAPKQLLRPLAIAGAIFAATLMLVNQHPESSPQPSVAQAQTNECITPTPIATFPYNYTKGRSTLTPVRCVHTSTPTPTVALTAPPTATPTITSTQAPAVSQTPTTTPTITNTRVPPTIDPIKFTRTPTPTVNLPPVAVNDSFPLSAVLLTGPTNATLVFSSDGSFTYTPNSGFTGSDSFTYEATDSFGADSAPATVTITVG